MMKKMQQHIKKINHIIHFFDKELHIPEKIIRQCLYVETVMGVSWCIEDGEEYTDFIKDIALAESILNEKIAF